MASILDKLFKPKTNKKSSSFNDAVSMVGYEPNFTKFGSQKLYSDLVLSAVKMKMRFFGKLEPKHIRNENGKRLTVNDSSIARVLTNPNTYQTTYDFLTQAYFMREKDDTCYIYADYYISNAGSKVYQGLYILLPMGKPEVRQDENGKLYIAFNFSGYNSEVIFDYNDIIIWKHNNEDNQYSGGGKYSSQANVDLVNSLSAYHTLHESITEASKLGCYIDGIVKVNAYAAEDSKAAEIRNKFIKDLQDNKTGVGVLDNGAEYQAIQRQLKMVDAATLNEIKENILINTGVSIEMLEGKFTTQDKEAFYENWIEPAAISLGQAMAKVFFSQWQTSHGDTIIIYPHKVQLMATSEIVSIIQSTISAGVFMIDEYREMLGYAPLENGEGQQRPRGFNNLDGNQDTPTEEVNNE